MPASSKTGDRSYPAAPRRSGPSTGTWLRAGLSLVLVALLILGVFLGVSWHRQHQLDNDRQQALAAARQETVDLMSLNYQTIKDSAKQVLAGATGTFKQQYQQGTDQIIAATTKSKVQAKATVLDAGVVGVDGKTVTVILVVDQTVTNAQTTTPQLRHQRMQLIMTEVKGAWLASQLDYITT